MTGRKKDRPTLGDVEVLGVGEEERPSGSTDPAEIERRRALASGFEAPDFVAARAGAGLVTVLRLPHGGTLPAPEVAIGVRSQEPNFTVRLPDYVQQSVRMRAVQERKPVRLVILHALQSAGFEVRAEDMTDERGIVSKRRAKEGRGGR